MPYICANQVFENCRDTTVAIYEITVDQLNEIRAAMDPENLFIDTSALSFEVYDLACEDPHKPFSGRIEFVGTFYDPG